VEGWVVVVAVEFTETVVSWIDLTGAASVLGSLFPSRYRYGWCFDLADRER
jgi:hypothetical protein